MNRYILSITFFLLLFSHAFATHIRGGEIIVERINQFSLTYRILVVGYRDAGSSIEFGGGTLNLGDTTIIEGPFESTREYIDNETEKTTFSYIHTYSSANGTGFLISYTEDYRNHGIINMDSSVTTPFYTETLLIIDPALGINNTPIFAVPPVDHAFMGYKYIHNPGVYDPDGDSLSFSLTVPKQGLNKPVNGYKLPSHPDFYSNTSQGSQSSHKAFFTIDPHNGTVIWDSPGDAVIPGLGYDQSEYNFALKVTEWRKFKNQWIKIGHAVRDMQVIVWDMKIDQPSLHPNDQKYVVPFGEEFGKAFSSRSTNPNEESSILAFGEPFDLGLAFSSPNSFWDSEAYMEITWDPSCSEIRDAPYCVYFNMSQTNF